ncbi:MAG: hypothetical protein ACPGQS_15265, partial [Bradymonadia bacterium]
MCKRMLMLLLLLHCYPIPLFAHPPIPLDEWSAQAAIDNLEVSVNRQHADIDRLLHLKGDTAEKVLRSAQEAWFNKAYAKAAKQLLAVTLVPGFNNHPARAAFFQWLGMSYAAMNFNTLAKETLLKAYTEPQQTKITRTNTITQLLKLPGSLPAGISEKLWAERKQTSPDESPYLYCRALYRSNVLLKSKTCFETKMKTPYDSARSLYFLGVLALRDNQLEDARKSFKTLLKMSFKRMETVHIKELDLERSTDTLRIDSGQVQGTDDNQWSDIYIRTRLALARLAAAESRWHDARVHYGYIPPGHALFFEASRERALVYDKLHQPKMAASALIAVGQASRTTGPGLKQSMWRAELLGRGEAYDLSTQTYAHIERHTKQVAAKFDSRTGNQERVPTHQKLRWLAPDLGLQFGELSSDIDRLQRTLNTLDAQIQQISSNAKKAFTQDLRSVEIAELEHRLKDIRQGINDRLMTTKLRQKLSQLQLSIVLIKQDNQRLKAHHEVFAAQMITALQTEIQDHLVEFSSVSETETGTLAAIESTVDSLLNTLETQSGLGKLNIYVWKKEAVSRQIAKTIEEKQRLIQWLEASDPGQTPT